jgi:hypothetical protein
MEIFGATSTMVGRICPSLPFWNRVKVSENLVATCDYIPELLIG